MEIRGFVGLRTRAADQSVGPPAQSTSDVRSGSSADTFVSRLAVFDDGSPVVAGTRRVRESLRSLIVPSRICLTYPCAERGCSRGPDEWRAFNVGDRRDCVAPTMQVTS